MFTTWAAYGEFAEHRRGKIRPGFDADLTILSDNILTCHPEKILEIDILGTVVNGRFVYSKIDTKVGQLFVIGIFFLKILQWILSTINGINKTLDILYKLII